MEAVIQEAQRACDKAAEIPVIAVNRDGYEFQLDGAKGIIQGAITSLFWPWKHGSGLCLERTSFHETFIPSSCLFR